MKSMTLVNFMSPLRGETTVPLGPLYVAAILEESGCYVDFRDYQLKYNNLSQKNIIGFLSDSEDIIGVSCLFNTLPFVLLSLEKIKSESPDKTIILGGPGPSSVAERLMEEFPFIDIVAKGEGESTMRDMALDKPLNQIKGIVYRSQGKVVLTEERERIQNLDRLPFPAYTKIDLSQYQHAGIITARGCPYHCSFCEVAPLWGHHTIQRSVSNVIKEIHMLYDSGIKNIHIHDDTFVLNRKWVFNFCSTLKKEDMGITWMCNGRINLMDSSLLENMVDAGCVAIQYGIESGSDHVLQMMGKHISVPQIREVISLSVKYMDTISTFMWGFPFETMNDFFQTIYLMGEVAKMGSLISLFLLAPTPLSQLCREYSGQLQFSEELISNLLWDIFESVPLREKNQIFEIIKGYPHIFSGFYHIHTPDIYEKYRFLKEAGLLR
ncbi:MAG: radical SAM protein [Theionarchaea archaeon]|nr:radical SAM protein [Theionarchaea archaeon]